MKYHQPYGVTDPNAPYINGDPSVGRAGSIPPAESIEYPQREIVALIADAGLALPDDGDLSQLAKAVQSQLLISDDDAGTSNAYQVTQSPAPSVYFKYMTVITKIGNPNTGPSVLNVNAMGPKPIVHIDGSPIVGGELRLGQICCFVYDGAAFQLVWSGGTVAGAPIYLTASRDYYVDGNAGNDAWDGTSAVFVSAVKGPFKTLQRASTEINKFNLNGFSVTVHVADYAGYANWTLPAPAGSGAVVWQGNSGNPQNVVVTGVNHTACNGYNCGVQTVDGFRLISTGSQSVNSDTCNCAQFSASSTITLRNIDWGACLGYSLYVGKATVGLYAAHRIVGSSVGGPIQGGGWIDANVNGNVGVNGLQLPTLAIPAAVTLPYFAIALAASNISLAFQGGITGYANVTGQKYLSATNSVIDSNGGGINAFPGTIAGATSNGGVYV
jgi:hypothetical protein